MVCDDMRTSGGVRRGQDHVPEPPMPEMLLRGVKTAVEQTPRRKSAWTKERTPGHELTRGCVLHGWLHKTEEARAVVRPSHCFATHAGSLSCPMTEET